MSRRRSVGFPHEWEPWADPSLVLGSSGPVRVSSEDSDPAFEPPRIRGFGCAVADVTTDQIQRVANAMATSVDDAEPVPLLWEGDQA